MRRIQALNILIWFVLSLSLKAGAETIAEAHVKAARDWKSFQSAMEELKAEEHHTGTSYIVSGALVTVGSLVGSQLSNDPATKLVYGIAEGIGVSAIGLGIARVTYGSEIDSFYDSLNFASLTNEQRAEVASFYLERERERRRQFKRIGMYSYLALGALNLYSAATEKDRSTKTLIGLLAGVNFAIALSYSF